MSTAETPERAALIEVAQAAADTAGAAARAAQTAAALANGQELARPAGAGKWGAPTPIGHFAALQSSGSIAAPLLAGFSFTMTALLLTSPGVSRWPDATLALFVAAGLVLIFTVQTSLWLQSNNVAPSDYQQWYPEHIVDGYPDDTAFGWHVNNARKAQDYANWTRRLYNLGILLLLAAVTSAVWPPGHVPRSRWVVIGVGVAGFVAELIWVVGTRVRNN